MERLVRVKVKMELVELVERLEGLVRTRVKFRLKVRVRFRVRLE